ncbi:MAG: Rab family GTPase, partial [Candidatus Thorarchaeota archaeon]
MKSIKRISIINAESGIEVYKKDIGSSFFLKHDNQLISGFISAIMDFSKSIVEEEIQEIVFANSRLFFKRFPTVIVVIMTTLGNRHNIINKVINDLGSQIEASGKIPSGTDPISEQITLYYDTLISKSLNIQKSSSLITYVKKPKIVIAGPKKAGKTTAIRKFFYSWDEDQLQTITPTVDYSILYSFMDVLKTELTIFDLGGQEQYINNHIAMEMKWKEAAAVIFMVDVSQPEEFSQANEYLMNVLRIFRSNNEEPFIGLFAHKFDPERTSEL